MEKHWVVYGWLDNAWDIGIVACNFKKGVYIQEIEEQKPPFDYWKLKRIKRFDTSEQAINYCFEHQGGTDSPESINDITKKLHDKFPILINKEKMQALNDLLSPTRTQPLSQSSPKCTDEKIDFCPGCLRKEKPC
jgi:hypothetical protein